MIGNTSGTMFNRKINVLIISSNTTPKMRKRQNLILKSQHLVMNLDLGLALKCAPGHKMYSFAYGQDASPGPETDIQSSTI